jgi:DNA-directed RNA polymerase specialized sigma24 family protein
MPDAALTELVRTIAARKLRAHGGFTPQDVEDAAGEAMLVLLERLRAADAGSAPPVADVEAYAATVAYNCCAHQIRQRYPQRARLKARLRYVLATDARLAVWDDAGAGAVAGLAAARSHAASPDADAALEALATSRDVHALAGDHAAGTPTRLARLTHAILTRLPGPVTLDRLVGGVARIGRLELDPATPADTSSEPPAPSQPDAAEARIDERRLLARLWDEVGALPIRQRVALLLHARDSAGGGVLWLLPVLGLATIRQIAAVLELPPLDLAALWPRLPLDDHSIAERLACTRQQVINLRMAGRKRLASRLRELRPAAARPPRPRGNLAPVSASMRHEP